MPSREVSVLLVFFGFIICLFIYLETFSFLSFFGVGIVLAVAIRFLWVTNTKRLLLEGEFLLPFLRNDVVSSFCLITSWCFLPFEKMYTPSGLFEIIPIINLLFLGIYFFLGFGRDRGFFIHLVCLGYQPNFFSFVLDCSLKLLRHLGHLGGAAAVFWRKRDNHRQAFLFFLQQIFFSFPSPAPMQSWQFLMISRFFHGISPGS